MFQLDASHVGIGAVTGATVLALSEALRYFVGKQSRMEKVEKDKREEVSRCKAQRIEEQNNQHQIENRNVLTSIRDGINKLVTIAERGSGRR